MTINDINSHDIHHAAPAQQQQEAPHAAPLRIAIMGAGIAGLSAALSLLTHFSPSSTLPPPPPAPARLQITIYEKATHLREIGASIALNPSGLRTLDKLGVHEALSPENAYRQPSGHPMVYRHWRTSEVIGWDEYRGAVEPRHGTARFHRAVLQGCLLRAVRERGVQQGVVVDMKLGARASRFEVIDEEEEEEKDDRHGEGRRKDGGDGRGVRITFEDGTTTEVDLLIGADGIHSKVRSTFAPEHQLKWTGQVALRAVFDAALVEGIEGGVPEDAVHIVGHETSFFSSYLGGRKQYTIVGNYFCDPKDQNVPYHDAKWDGPGDVEFLKGLYKDWSPLVRSLTSVTPYINTYPNHAGTPLASLVFGGGRVILLGDAAHTHGGAFAAGGSLAINDAYCLAMALSHCFSSSKPATQARQGEQLAAAARLYDETRRPLVTRLLDTVHGNAKVKKEAREKKGGKQETEDELQARLDKRPDLSWLSEHDVEEEFEKVVSRLG